MSTFLRECYPPSGKPLHKHTPTPPAGTVELILSWCIRQIVSVNIERRRDGPGETDHVDRAWQLKERIHQREGVLKQRRGFFTDAYRRAATVLYFEDDTLVAFGSVRRDGYILFLAVAPEARGRGYGERLIAEIAEDYATITCHARTSNESALGFYQHLGFEIDRRIDSYYEDNGDAYYLKTRRQRRYPQATLGVFAAIRWVSTRSARGQYRTFDAIHLPPRM